MPLHRFTQLLQAAIQNLQNEDIDSAIITLTTIRIICEEAAPPFKEVTKKPRLFVLDGSRSA